LRLNINLKSFISFSLVSIPPACCKVAAGRRGTEKRLRVSQKPRSAESKQSDEKIELPVTIVEQIPIILGIIRLTNKAGRARHSVRAGVEQLTMFAAGRAVPAGGQRTARPTSLAQLFVNQTIAIILPKSKGVPGGDAFVRSAAGGRRLSAGPHRP
jgi:hypothetical protein